MLSAQLLIELMQAGLWKLCEFTDTRLPENPKQTFFFLPPSLFIGHACFAASCSTIDRKDFCHFRSRRSKLLDSTAVTSSTDSSCYQHFHVDNIYFDTSEV